MKALLFFITGFFILLTCPKTFASNQNIPLSSVVFTISNDSIQEQSFYLDNARTYITLSDILKEKYDYKNALEKIHQALSIYTNYQDCNGEFYCYLKIAELYRVRLLFKESDAYLKRAAVILKSNKAKISKSNVLAYYNRKAAIFSEYYKKQDSALVYSKLALALANESKNLDMQFFSIMELGKVFEDKKNLTKAMDYYRQALTKAELLKSTSKKCDALVNIARIYHKNKALDLAIQTNFMGLELLKNKGYSFQKLLFYDNLQKLYEEKGDKTKAFDFLKTRLELTEIYYNNLYDDKVLEYESKYNIIEKEKTLIKKDKQLAIVENQLEKEKAIIINIVLVATLISLLIVVVSLYYIKSRRKNFLLEKISRENEFLLGEANHRINNNLQLIIVLIEDELQKYAQQLETRLPLEKVLIKLEAISTLHRQLYKSEEKSKIEIQHYLLEVKQNFSDIFEAHSVQTNFNVDKLYLPTNTALYLGLLVTELCTNSLKHAFKNQKDKHIELLLITTDNVLCFEYRDNGASNLLSKALKPKLVDKLCRQLKVTYKITYNKGFMFKFAKPLD